MPPISGGELLCQSGRPEVCRWHTEGPMNHAFVAALFSGLTILAPLGLFGQCLAEAISREQILATGPEWQENHDGYEPPADMIEALKTRLGSDIRIDVYLGLWCADSKKSVPPLIKILDRVEPAASVRYFIFPKKETKEVKFFMEELKVDRVPTIILYRTGKEIGRIVESPQTGMIEDIMEIIFR
jgi:hypothetical protein